MNEISRRLVKYKRCSKILSAFCIRETSSDYNKAINLAACHNRSADLNITTAIIADLSRDRDITVERLGMLKLYGAFLLVKKVRE